MMIAPLKINCMLASNPMYVRQYVKAVKIKVPMTAPLTLPTPPLNEIPPTTQAAIASSSVPVPVDGLPTATRVASKKPPKPYRTPAMMNIPMVTQKTLIPETDAASAFPPTAYMYLPNFVLFQMNHTTAIAITEKMIRLMLLSPLIVLAQEISILKAGIEAKRTIMIPYEISCVESVVMNGCILNFAVKKPAIDVKRTQMMIDKSIAMMNDDAKLRPVKSQLALLTTYTFEDMIIQTSEIEAPVKRPIDKSVPAIKINPATPSE